MCVFVCVVYLSKSTEKLSKKKKKKDTNHIKPILTQMDIQIYIKNIKKEKHIITTQIKGNESVRGHVMRQRQL